MLIEFTKKNKIKIWDGIYGSIHHSDHITMGHIEIEAGTVLPPHHHVHEQWSTLLEGDMEFVVGEEVLHLTPGNTIYIPSNIVHSGKAHTSCKLIDVFNPPREDWKKLTDL
jgi:quercetin dioxygenase-like cupin family protein